MNARHSSGWVAVVITLVVALVVTAAWGAGGAAQAAPSSERGTPAPGRTGAWDVQQTGPGRFQVSWTSPSALPITSDRPTIIGPDGAQVGVSTIADDGRTVQAVVTSSTRPTPADLGVVLSGDRLDVPGSSLRSGGAGAAGTRRELDLPGTETLPVDPATPGPYAVTSSDYELDPVKLAGMRNPIEMVGHVVEPAAGEATGPRPLVLFLHGRHTYCYDPTGESDDWDADWPCQAPFEEIPSQLGYDYIQQVLASQGYATVSIRVNGINAQDYRLDDGGAGARAEIVARHLDHWTDIAAEHQVDLDRVVLVGHSRGGEGVDRASIRIPLSAPYRIVGQVLIAPTDFANQAAPYVPTVTLLPFCDGDVSDLQGQRFTDVARDVARDDTSLKSSVLVMGANHNFFNTEWTPGIAQAPSFDDWGDRGTTGCGKKNPDRLSAAEQRSVGTAYVAGAVHLFADDDQDVLPLFDGSRARVASTGDAQVLSHAIGGGRDLRTPGVGTGLSLPDGATTRFCVGANTGTQGSCSRGQGYNLVRPHWPDSYERVPTRPFFEMSWTAVGQSGGMVLEQPLDLSAGRLELRTIVDARRADADLRVRITDADGVSAELTPAGDGVYPALAVDDVKKLWAQTVVVDPAGATGVDLTRVDRVDLVSASETGRVWVADLGVAPAELAAVPERRAPVIDLSTLRMPEGDGTGTQTAELPFTIQGEVTRPARFVVATAGQQRGSTQRFTIDLAPGQTSGSVPIDYQPDDRDDFPSAQTDVTVYPLTGMMTDVWNGRLTILDDDPMPKVTVTPVRRAIAEGATATWRVRLAGRVDYDLYPRATVVRGPSPRLAVADVPEAWRDRYGAQGRPTTPLAAARVMLYERLRTGSTVVDYTIPTRRDGVAEPRESVTMTFRVGDRTITRTIFVKRSS